MTLKVEKIAYVMDYEMGYNTRKTLFIVDLNLFDSINHYRIFRIHYLIG